MFLRTCGPARWLGSDLGLIVLALPGNDLTPRNQHYPCAGTKFSDGAVIEQIGILLDALALAEYTVTVPFSTRSFLAAAVTKMAEELELLAKGSASPDNIDRVQVSVFQAQVLQKAVRSEIKSGRRAQAQWESGIQDLHHERPAGLWMMMAAGLRPRLIASWRPLRAQREKFTLPLISMHL